MSNKITEYIRAAVSFLEPQWWEEVKKKRETTRQNLENLKMVLENNGAARN